MRRLLSTIGVVLIFGTLLFLPHGRVFAETTPFRSAHSISTAPTTSTTTAFINLENCSETDGLTCDRIADSKRGGSLYFTDFDDFGIPDGSTITHVRIRVTGFAGENMYIGVYGGKSTAYAACQHPTWRWQVYLPNTSPYSVHNEYESMSNGSLDYCLSLERIRTNNFMFYLHWASTTGWSANIDNFEIAFDYTPSVTPTPTSTITPTPTQTPTPTPSAPEPFLDLPWDYKGKGMSFSTAATRINSYFDHEYPLLSTNLNEPVNLSDTIVNYKDNLRKNSPYSSHDGYDWGSLAKANPLDPVLAAADGLATYRGESECSACGNSILIDHENGFQTRYYHLNFDDIFRDRTGGTLRVEKGDIIGRVGWTGNCWSTNSSGQQVRNTPACAHIHFMVVYDKNGDGDFKDNIPDGLIDPFGWQSEKADPWENYTFDYLGTSRTGMKSTYLWITSLGSADEEVPPNGKEVDLDKYSIDVSENVNDDEPFYIKAYIVPVLDLTNISLRTLLPGISLKAFTLSGDPLISFTNFITITADFSEIDLSRYDPETIAIYSSTDEVNWVKETGTVVDLDSKKATVTVDHFTYFVLFAERIDTTPPTTSAVIDGLTVKPNKYTSDTELTFQANDGEGLGIYYTLYQLDQDDWKWYLEPISISKEGNHTLKFYSVDNDDNKEDIQVVNFAIDKTLPESIIQFDPESREILVSGTDSSGSATVKKDYLRGTKSRYTIEDEAGNNLVFNTSTLNIGTLKTFHIDMLEYSNGDDFDLDRNILGVLYTQDRKKNIIGIVQTFYQEGHEVVILSYTKSSNRTKVTVKERGREKVVEELDGMKILQLYTDRGTLKYRY